MTQTGTITRPELTFPQAEADLVRATYAGAGAVLEYGSGGSTVLAAEMGRRVISVESDKDWALMMRGWFAQNPPKGTVDIVWSDIGPTKEWGHPVDDRGWKRFARYPLEVWDLDEFTHPDVVLVDGRFRVGCALATAFRCTRPVTLLFDDYSNRSQFHEVESFIGAPRQITGRMAVFDVHPTPVPPDRLLRVIQFMMRP